MRVTKIELGIFHVFHNSEDRRIPVSAKVGLFPKERPLTRNNESRGHEQGTWGHNVDVG
jgi:hypothetical protein